MNVDTCTVLLVDDDIQLLSAVKRTTRGLRQICVATASSSRAALELAAQARPDLAIVDLVLGSESGTDLIAALKRMHAEMRIAATTAAASTELVQRAIAAGAVACVRKPFTLGGVAAVVGLNRPVFAAASLVQHVTLARVEWDHVRRVYDDYGGNTTQTARVLGISKATLRKKLATPRPPT